MPKNPGLDFILDLTWVKCNLLINKSIMIQDIPGVVQCGAAEQVQDKLEEWNMNWVRIKPLFAEQLIIEFENVVGYLFPTEFKEVIKIYNGASPESKEFRYKQGNRIVSRVFNNLIFRYCEHVG